jgi:translation initiation factor IF-3
VTGVQTCALPIWCGIFYSVFIRKLRNFSEKKEGATISTQDFRVNETIRIPEVRVIDHKGENLGVISTREALQIAREAELDLVEVSPNANPPVCRVMDFGKFLYERTKKEKEARKAQTKIEIKEIRLRPKTNEHHRGFKTRDARRWLEDGMKVRVTIRFRGREISYPELALEDLKEIAQELSDIASIEQAPGIEGRVMSMLLMPNAKKIAKRKAAIESGEIQPVVIEDESDETDEDFDDEDDDEDETTDSES